MADADRDPALDALLDLDGQVFFVDDKAKHWVKFEVKRVAPSIARGAPWVRPPNSRHEPQRGST